MIFRTNRLGNTALSQRWKDEGCRDLEERKPEVWVQVERSILERSGIILIETPRAVSELSEGGRPEKDWDRTAGDLCRKLTNGALRPFDCAQGRQGRKRGLAIALHKGWNVFLF